MNVTYTILRHNTSGELYPLGYTHEEPTVEEHIGRYEWASKYDVLAKFTRDEADAAGFPMYGGTSDKRAWAEKWLAEHLQQAQPAQDTQAQVEKAIDQVLTSGMTTTPADALMIQRDKDAIAARKPAPSKHEPTAPREPRPLAAALMLDPDYTTPLVSPAWGLAAVTSR